MKKMITDKENTKAIILNENDNIVIALENMNAGQYLKQFALKIDAQILSVQKIAKIDISENSPIYKYGTIIGLKTSKICPCA